MKKPTTILSDGREFRTTLHDLDLTPSNFAHMLTALGDPTPDLEHLVSQWTQGKSTTPGPAVAMLTLLAVLRQQQGITPAQIWEMMMAATPKVDAT